MKLQTARHPTPEIREVNIVKLLHTRLRASAAPDAGLSLIEVIVAMMIFAMLSIGVAYSLLSTLTLTRDSRSREVAANVAAQEIDLDRASKDVFNLLDTPSPVETEVDGVTYYLQRSTRWVTGEGAPTGCGTGTGTLQYKRINVTVTWSGMRASTAPVRADTLLSPRDRINDPTLGTVIISVLTATGSGSAGVSVSATPSAGVAGNTAVGVTGPVTDAQGCSYLLKVTPGTYDVTISRTGYINDQQFPTTITQKNVLVAAGQAVSKGFLFDQAAQFPLSYASNYTAGSVQLPTNLDTSLISTAGLYSYSATTAATSRTLNLYPFPGGYAAMAGKYIAPSESSDSCLSVDPGAWPADATTGAVGTRTQATAAATTGIPMGLIKLSGLNGKYLKAVSATATGNDDPGCATGMTYTFSALSPSGTIALPWGSWQLYSGGPASQTTSVRSAAVSVAAPSSVTLPTGIITLDPRQVVAP